jgi:hypothetical protein
LSPIWRQRLAKLGGLHLKTETESSFGNVAFEQETRRWIISRIVIIKHEYHLNNAFGKCAYYNTVYLSSLNHFRKICFPRSVLLLLTGTLVSGATWETDYDGTVTRSAGTEADQECLSTSTNFDVKDIHFSKTGLVHNILYTDTSLKSICVQ